MIYNIRIFVALGLLLTLMGGCSCDAPSDAPPSEGRCTYTGYGSQCVIPCNASPDLRFDVRVLWSGSYSCTWVGPSESFSGCRCRSGYVECPRSTGYWSAPSSTCESFPERDVGTISRPDANSTPDAYETPDAHETPDAFMPDAG